MNFIQTLEGPVIELVALVSAILGFGFLGYFFRLWFLRAGARKGGTENNWLWALVQGTGWALYLAIIASFLATFLAKDYEKISTYLERMALLLFLWQVGRWGEKIAEILYGLGIKKSQDPAGKSTLGLLYLLGRICLWGTILLLFLSNLGVNISALIAGLGIGSLAVALAVQNILGDLFASLSIMMDRPFLVGDSITVDKDSGTVEHIGWKTTRIRSTSGEEIIFSNSDLLKSRIRNFRRMSVRRGTLALVLTFESPKESLAKLESVCEEAVTATGARFERVRFVGFGSLGLEYELSFWINSPDFSVYSKVQTDLALCLKNAFEAHKLEFAQSNPRSSR